MESRSRKRRVMLMPMMSWVLRDRPCVDWGFDVWVGVELRICAGREDMAIGTVSKTVVYTGTGSEELEGDGTKESVASAVRLDACLVCVDRAQF
jgi:hypothetical protein